MKFLLNNKNFLFLLLGRIITNIGDSIYYVASMWLVFELGGSTFYTGLAGTLVMLPKVFQFLVGPLIDRWRIKKILVISQALQCILILVIPISYYLDILTVQMILMIMPIIAVIEQFTYPAQNKALPLTIHKSDLVKGNTYFSFAYQGIDLIFNSIAGILVAVMGAISLFLLDSVTFAITAMLFSLLKLPETGTDIQKDNEYKGISNSIRNYIIELKEGCSIVFKSLIIIFLIGAIFVNFAIGITYSILPSYSAVKGGPEVYGYYLTALSAGSLIGAILASVLKEVKVSILVIIGFFLAACCWYSSSMITSVIISVILFGIAWIPIGGTNVIFGSIIQSVIPNSLLGRVSSVVFSISSITLPIGSFIGGYLGTIINNETIFMYTGLGSLLISMIWLLHPKLRSLSKSSEINAETFNLKVSVNPIKEESKIG